MPLVGISDIKFTDIYQPSIRVSTIKINRILPLHFVWSIVCKEYFTTGAQLRHNDFRIFADPSRIFTYNCDETFKTTSRTLIEYMPGHA